MKTPLRRAEKRLLGGSLALALLLGGLGLFLARANAPLDAAPPPAPPNPNGFDLYVAAAKAIVPATPPVDQLQDTVVRTPQQADLLYTAKRRAAWLARNTPAWALFRQAQAAQSRHPAWPVTSYQILRDLARSKSIESKEWKARGQWNAAMASSLDTIEMGHDIERGAPLIGGLVGVVVTAIGAASGEDVPPHLNAREAAQSARRLENLMKTGVPLSAILREEKRVVQSNILTGKPLYPNRVVALLRPPRRIAATVGTMMDGLIAEADKPFALQSAPPAPTGWFGAEAAILHPVFTRAYFNWARRAAIEQQLLLRLALRAYRLDYGAYPPTPAQLAPRYLAQVPVDPFGRGAIWRYKRVGDSYAAWSIGPDRTDNGGKPIARRKKDKRIIIYPESRGDIVAAP